MLRLAHCPKHFASLEYTSWTKSAELDTEIIHEGDYEQDRSGERDRVASVTLIFPLRSSVNSKDRSPPSSLDKQVSWIRRVARRRYRSIALVHQNQRR